MYYKREIFLDVYRLIAIIFIMNSHYEGVYPVELAIGGEIGLAIFFTLTGFLGKIDVDKNGISWFVKKVIRIYIPLIVYEFFMILLGLDNLDGIKDIFDLLFKNFWFAPFIILVYLLLAIYQKIIEPRYGEKSIYAIIEIILAIFVLSYITTVDFSTFCMMTPSFYGKTIWLICSFIGLLFRNNSKLIVNKFQSAMG